MTQKTSVNIFLCLLRSFLLCQISNEMAIKMECFEEMNRFERNLMNVPHKKLTFDE